MTKIAIFASGSGSNAENIIKSFSDTTLTIPSIFCNKKNAGIIDRAKRLSVPCRIFSREEFYDSNTILSELLSLKVDYIILAGFLWKIPESLISAFPNKIINIHPALLPNYGGKGMYGSFVHEAVIANKEKESGITIHLVDEKYDNGTIIFQARCPIHSEDTPESLATKVHELEYKHFPSVIREYINKNS
jgi:phosphoribosylglycinamide formyltransferase-1